MKKVFAVAVLVLMVAFSLSAFAIEGTTSITLRSAVQLDGKQISAGEYKVKWSGSNDDLQVTFTAGKKQIATTKAKLVEHEQASPYAAVVVNNSSLKEILMANKKAAIVFAN